MIQIIMACWAIPANCFQMAIDLHTRMNVYMFDLGADISSCHFPELQDSSNWYGTYCILRLIAHKWDLMTSFPVLSFCKLVLTESWNVNISILHLISLCCGGMFKDWKKVPHKFATQWHSNGGNQDEHSYWKPKKAWWEWCFDLAKNWITTST